MDTLNQIEAGWLLWIQENLRNGVMDSIMPLFSKINNGGILAIITVVALLLWKKTRRTGVMAFLSLGTEYTVVNILIKPLVKRIRPFVVNESLQLLGEYPTDYSFPSGHTGSAFAVAFVCLLCLPRKYGVTAIAVAFLIAFSRLYNVAHYPTDVLVSFGIAFLTAWMARYIVTWWTEKRKRSI